MNNNLSDQKPKNEDVVRDRGILLTVFLGLVIGLHTVILLALCARAAQLIYYTDMRYIDLGGKLGDPYLITFPLVGTAFVFQSLVLACLVAVCQWQKWGYYGLIVAYVIQAGLMLTVGSILAAGGSIIGLIMLVVLVHSRIAMFEKTSYEQTLRDRGALLTLFLVFLISVNAFTLIVLSELVTIRLRFGASVQGMVRIFGAEFIVPSIGLVFAVAVWRWKTWGFYALTAFYVIQIVIALFSINLPVLLSSMIPLGIFLALVLVNNRLEMFE